MILSVIGFIAVVLTCTMFATKQMMLGFPCVIFWAILGGYAYTLSVYDWDLYYLIFFACAFGMTIFCALAMYGLREKRDTIAEEELEKGEPGYIDEGKEKSPSFDEESTEEEAEGSERTRKLRERAKNRRSGKSRRRRL